MSLSTDTGHMATARQCAAPCGVELSTLNLINGDSVHEDCKCFYRECRRPLTSVLALAATHL